MALLNTYEYGNIIFAAKTFSELEDIADHFLAEFKSNINDNPRFITKLNSYIQDSITKVNELIAVKIQTDLNPLNTETHSVPKEQEYYNKYGFPSEKLGFGLIHYKGGSRMSLKKLTDIEKGFELFKEKISDNGPQTIKQKVMWNGKLKEFAELIVELERHEWIELPHGQVNQIVKTICLCFDFVKTKKSANSNTENSLLQYLKPSEKEDKIFTKRYVTKFANIIPNTTKK